MNDAKLAWAIIAVLLGAIVSGAAAYINLTHEVRDAVAKFEHIAERQFPQLMTNFQDMIDTHGKRIDGLSSRVRRMENILMSGATDGELTIEKIEKTEMKADTELTIEGGTEIEKKDATNPN